MTKEIKKNYSAWHAAESFNSEEELIVICAEYASLAPSVHNAQPWRFEILKNNTVNIRPIKNKKLISSDPKGHYVLISLGAALENYCQAAEAFGFTPKVSIKPEATGLQKSYASVSITKSKRPIDAHKLRNIKKRYSEKRVGTNPKSLSKKVKANLVSAGSSNVNVYFTDDREQITKLAMVYYLAAESFKSNKQFARELSSWIRKSKTNKHDGMTAKSSDLPGPKAFVGKMVLKVTPKILSPMAKKYLHMITSSDAVGCITTLDESDASIIAAGRELERLSLAATDSGYSLTALAAIIEKPESSKELKKILGTQGFPQIFFRIIPARDNHTKAPRHQVQNIIKHVS